MYLGKKENTLPSKSEISPKRLLIGGTAKRWQQYIFLLPSNPGM